MSKFVIETRMFCGWENTWSDDEETPVSFESVDQAQAALAEHLADLREAVAGGHMSDYSPEDFRIVEVSE